MCVTEFFIFLGRNGDTIRSMTRQSKAKIVIDAPDRRSDTRPVVISLTGTAQAIATAKVLLCYLSPIGIVPDQFYHFTIIASSTTNMTRLPPNLHTMVPRWACIQDVLKVKVKGHVVRTLICLH